MSKSLYWFRVPIPPKDYNIGSLKYVLAEKLWGADGSCGQSPIIVNNELIPFLEGIIVGNGSGDMGRDAKQLLEAILKYKEVQLAIKE